MFEHPCGVFGWRELRTAQGSQLASLIPFVVFTVDGEPSIFIPRHTGADQCLVNWYSPCMSSRCVEVTSVAKVNKKSLVTRFCIAMRAPGSELLPSNVGSMDKLGRPASFWIPPLNSLAAPWARSELAPRLEGVAAACWEARTRCRAASDFVTYPLATTRMVTGLQFHCKHEG
jgi:hypothetical protein